MMLYITGVGSRETPLYTLGEMKKIGEWCRSQKIVVRSGHAEGADWAFEQGAREFTHAYLPWSTFNRHLPPVGARFEIVMDGAILNRAREIINQIHPCPSRLTQGALNMHSRNCFQVLGSKLVAPSQALVCWTKGGKAVGGTATAINLAINHKIPVMNMFDTQYSSAEKVIAALTQLQETK